MRAVPAEKLHEVWDWVRKGLEHVQRKGGDSWIPEDVYMQLRSKSAHLCVIEDKGFIVYQILTGDDNRGVLHIWCIWGPLKEYEQQVYEELDKYAKQLGVARIRGIGRKGWSRRGYFKLVGYVYEREII